MEKAPPGGLDDTSGDVAGHLHDSQSLNNTASLPTHTELNSQTAMDHWHTYQGPPMTLSNMLDIDTSTDGTSSQLR